MLDDLGWRSLENRRIDCRLVLFYKIIYGNVAIQIPDDFEKPRRYTRHMHPLSFRQSMHLPVSTNIHLPSYNFSLECSASRHCLKD